MHGAVRSYSREWGVKSRKILLYRLSAARCDLNRSLQHNSIARYSNFRANASNYARIYTTATISRIIWRKVQFLVDSPHISPLVSWKACLLRLDSGYLDMKILLLLLLLIPQLASAKVYMCVDPATGKTSFTDKACATVAAREEVRVGATNLDSGSRPGRGSSSKTWTSDRDTRKTGLDYNTQRRGMYDNSPTASTD